MNFTEQEERETHYGCKRKTITNRSAEEREQLKVKNLCGSFSLVQINHMPTINDNTLELLFTNDTALFINTDINKRSVSDHNIIETTTTYSKDGKEKQ